MYNYGISDIDECFEEDHNCLSEDYRKCNNTVGGFECVCDNGYEENSNGTCVGKYGHSGLTQSYVLEIMPSQPQILMNV